MSTIIFYGRAKRLRTCFPGQSAGKNSGTA